MISLALIFYDILHTVPLLHDFRLPHNHHCTNAEVSRMQAKALEPLWTMCRLRTPGGLLQGGRQEEKLGIWASAVLLGHTQGSQCLLLWYLGSFIKIWFFLQKFLSELLLLNHFSFVGLCATLQMAAHQAPPSLGFARQEHWSGLPFPSPMHESEK